MSETALFVLAAGILLLAALFILLRPLGRGETRLVVDRREANLAVLRDELRELERSRDEGSLSEDDFTQARDELQRRLLEETGPEPAIPAIPTIPAAGKRTAIALSIAIPLAAAVIYVLLGNPRALDGTHADPQAMDAMLRGLPERLKANPDDTQGWLLLARSYKTLGRFAESAEAFGRIESRLDENPALLADYAEVLALAGGGSFAGKPDALIARALKDGPNEPQVLFAAGASANARGDFAAVVDYWGRLLRQLDPDSDDARALAAAIEEKRTLLRSRQKINP
jgi:cytochrome c-type biogenesis protein CcmH